jgi:hypothetical protein
MEGGNLQANWYQAGNNQFYCESSQAEFLSNIKIYQFNFLRALSAGPISSL